jgi:hypothetical protein
LNSRMVIELAKSIIAERRGLDTLTMRLIGVRGAIEPIAQSPGGASHGLGGGVIHEVAGITLPQGTWCRREAGVAA